jgi:hypothetical protein
MFLKEVRCLELTNLLIQYNAGVQCESLHLLQAFVLMKIKRISKRLLPDYFLKLHVNVIHWGANKNVGVFVVVGKQLFEEGYPRKH